MMECVDPQQDFVTSMVPQPAQKALFGLAADMDIPEEDVVLDSADAKRDALVREFVGLCDAAHGQGVLDLEMLQQRSMMRFWSALVILRWEPAAGDFLCVLFGTMLRDHYGGDCTGKMIFAENPFGGLFRKVNRHVLCERETVYFSGTLGWRQRGFVRYHAVILPLQRRGVVAETVTLVSRC